MTTVNKLISYLAVALPKPFSVKKALLIPLCFMLIACEEAKEKSTTTAKDVRLLRPSSGLVLSLADEQLRVQYTGAATHENVAVELNGVLCSQDAAAICRMRVHRQYGTISASLESLAHIIVPGENTVVLINTETGERDTLTFYFDNQAPKLEVLEVIGGTGPQGEPVAGDSITVNGRLVDPSAVRDLRIVSAGVVTDLTLVASTTLLANQFTNELNSDGDKTFSATFIWPDNTVQNAQISYVVSDIHNQERKEAFMVAGTQLSKSAALQVNDDFFDNLKAVYNPLVKNVLSLLEQENQILPLIADAIPQSIAGEICVGLMDKPANECFAEVTGINVVNPALHMQGAYDEGHLSVGMWFDALYVSIAVYHNCDPSTAACSTGSVGRFSTTVHLDSFRLRSLFEIKPGIAGEAFSLVRKPSVNLDLEGILNHRAVLHNTACVNVSCVVGGGLLELGYNFGLSASGRKLGDALLSGITEGLNSLLSTKSCAIDELLDVAHASCVLDPDFYAQNSLDDVIANNFKPTLNIVDLPLMVESVHKATNHGGHNVHASLKVDAASVLTGTLTQAAINQMGFGIPFANQTGYASVKYSTYPHKVPGVGGQGIDLAFAVSANSANQYLQALHRSGELNGKKFAVSGTDLLSDLGLSGVSNACLELDTQTAPSPKVAFTGYQSKKSGASFEFLGLSLVNTTKADVPGTARIAADYLTVHVHNQACSSANVASRVASAVVDASVHVSLNIVGGKPEIKAFEDFVDVWPRYPAENVSVAGAGIVTSALVANVASKLLSQNITEQLDAFNEPKGEYKPLLELFAAFDDKIICQLPAPDGLTILSAGQTCSGTNLGGVDDFLYGFFVSPSRILPMEFGMNFSSFGIEPSGGFFTFTLGIKNKILATSDNLCPDANTADGTYVPSDASYFRAICFE